MNLLNLVGFLQAESSAVILIIICLMLSAFFSSAETAITSLGIMKAKHIIEKQEKGYNALKLWINKPSHMITTILVFNNVVNILASAVTTQLTNKYFQNGAIGIATGITTFLVLVFGEIIPKSFAKSHGDKLSVFYSRIIYSIYLLTFPMIRALSGFADWVIKLVSHGSKKAPLITEEEIEFMVSEGEKAGVIRDLKKDIIESAFDFDETKVREIMTPRTDLTAIPVDGTLDTIIEETLKTGHSRIPVYRENIDHIVGLILAKDLLRHSNTPLNEMEKITAESIMREAFFTPESKSIMEVFKDLKRTKNHLAIIIDEYGGTAGIVTMEDILEEIVGEIQDEFDAEEAEVLQVGDQCYEVSGSMNIDEFFEYFHIKKENLSEEQQDESIDTLAGWATQLIGEMPKVGQQVKVKNLSLELLEVSNRRIDIIRVTKLSEEEATSPEEEEVKKDLED